MKREPILGKKRDPSKNGAFPDSMTRVSHKGHVETDVELLPASIFVGGCSASKVTATSGGPIAHFTPFDR